MLPKLPVCLDYRPGFASEPESDLESKMELPNIRIMRSILSLS